MRILILHSRYLSGAASGENQVAADEASLLREAGHEVVTWTPEPQVGGALNLLRTGTSAVWSAAATARVRRLVRERRIDVVHAHNLFPTLSPAVLRSARAGGAAVVMTLHNYRLMCLSANFLRDGKVCELCLGRAPWPGVRYRCYRDSAAGSAALAASLTVHRAAGTFDAVTRYLAVSSFVRDKHVEAGMDPARIDVKPNFTWPARRREGPGSIFLFLGRLAPEKGADTLLRAWALDRSAGPLVFAGDGPERSRLEAMAPQGVEFLGAVPHAEVSSLLARARALLVPSRWYEAAPRGIIEAYAAGVPVIASDLGALPEAVQEGVTGLLATPDDAAGWAKAARELVDDARSIRLGENAYRSWRERYGPEAGLRSLEAAYRRALESATGPSTRR